MHFLFWVSSVCRCVDVLNTTLAATSQSMRNALSAPRVFSGMMLALVFSWSLSLAAQTLQTYRLIETIDMSRKLGLHSSTAQYPFSLALDEREGIAYVFSKSSPHFPVISLDSVRQIQTLSVPFTPPVGLDLCLRICPTRKLLYLYAPRPTAGKDSLKTIYAISTESRQLVATASYRDGVNDIALDESSNRLFLADNTVLRILNAATLQEEDTVALGFSIGGIAVDSVEQVLYLTSRDLQVQKMTLTLLALSKPYSFLKTLTIATPSPLPGIFLDSNRVILVGASSARVVERQNGTVEKSLTFGGSYPLAAYSRRTQRLFVANESGYGGHGEGGNHGKLLALGIAADYRDSLRLGLRISALALDDTRDILAALSRQQATVMFYSASMLRPVSAERQAVSLACRFDDMQISPDGATVYLANRYGAKSKLLAYTFPTQELTELPAGKWTTSLAVDSARGRLFAFSQQENMIYIYSTITNAFLGKTPLFGYKELRTDVPADIALDKARQKLFVCMPEHKMVTDIDLSTATSKKSYKVLGYSFAPEEESLNGGLQVSFVPELNKLYVLRARQKHLNIYNVTNGVLDTVNLATKWTASMHGWMQDILIYDPVSKYMFVGGIGIETAKNHGSLQVLAGASRFLGYHSRQTAMFALNKTDNVISLQEHDPTTFALKATRFLYSTESALPPLVHFDSKRNHLLLLEPESGILRRYDVNTLVSTPPLVKLDTALTTLSIYPNPVISQATVRFGVRNKEKVKLTILDTHGKEVAVLTESEYEPGTHTITLKVESSTYSTQTYFVQLKSPSMYYKHPIQIQRQ